MGVVGCLLVAGVLEELMVELEADIYVSRPPTYRLDKSMDIDQIQGTGYMQ